MIFLLTGFENTNTSLSIKPFGCLGLKNTNVEKILCHNKSKKNNLRWSFLK